MHHRQLSANRLSDGRKRSSCFVSRPSSPVFRLPSSVFRPRPRARPRARARARARARSDSGLSRTTHPRKHRNDPPQQSLRFLRFCLRQEPRHPTDIHESRALHRRSPRNPIKACPIRRSWLPRAFCDVQRNRHGRPLELIADLALPSGQASDEAESEGQEFDGAVVDVEVFVIEEGHSLLSAEGGARLRGKRREGGGGEAESDRERARARARKTRTGTRTGDGRRKTGDGRRGRGTTGLRAFPSADPALLSRE
jgi:hypothetical protein